ncbi:hypothetical protein OS493_024758 [Desmophyllum pertusum]|uniref:Uncharacterized protein n=1 Tax=Desmophyllum pertusum TaxID=174260 RepID=A0A9W9ZAY9_9CNID|nr:hypothetical protein OS493_024758 [Desmophyllum pertusum]
MLGSSSSSNSCWFSSFEHSWFIDGCINAFMRSSQCFTPMVLTTSPSSVTCFNPRISRLIFSNRSATMCRIDLVHGRETQVERELDTWLDVFSFVVVSRS